MTKRQLRSNLIYKRLKRIADGDANYSAYINPNQHNNTAYVQQYSQQGNNKLSNGMTLDMDFDKGTATVNKSTTQKQEKHAFLVEFSVPSQAAPMAKRAAEMKVAQIAKAIKVPSNGAVQFATQQPQRNVDYVYEMKDGNHVVARLQTCISKQEIEILLSQNEDVHVEALDW